MIQFLSYSLDEQTPSYGNGPKFSKNIDKCIDHGSSCNQFTFSMSNHLGTHLDCPNHFSATGRTITDYDAEFWINSKVSLVEINPDDRLISLEKYQNQITADSELILLKTGFCYRRQEQEYWSQNPGVHSDSALFLRSYCPKLKFLGMDFISLTSYLNREEGKKAHQAFLQDKEHPILLIEDMDLTKISTSPKQVIVSPLRISRADGGPVTVMAWT